MKYHEIPWAAALETLSRESLPFEVTFLRDVFGYNDEREGIIDRHTEISQASLPPDCYQVAARRPTPSVDLFCFKEGCVFLLFSSSGDDPSYPLYHRGPRSIHGDIVLPCANPYWIHFPIESTKSL